MIGVRGWHLLGLIALAIMLQAIPSMEARAADAAAGLKIVKNKCVRCHAIKTGGRGSHPDAPTFATLFKRYPPATLAEAFAEGIVVGHPDMPKFVFSTKQIDDLIAYLETLR